MSSDTETSTDSSSSESYMRRKSSKKRKHQKSEKKHKKHKKEKSHKTSKRSRQLDEQYPVVQKIAPSSRVETNDDVGAFGPALPPHLIQKQTEQPKLYGPIMPSDFPKQYETEQAEPSGAATTVTAASSEEQQQEEEDDDDAGTYGPVPVFTSTAGMSATQIKLEERALQLKLAAIDGASTSNVDQTEREEWMLELPEVGLKSGLAALSNMKRGFHQGKERPDFSDRSSWTKTPEGAAKPAKPSTSKSAVETLKSEAEARYERQRDEEQERMAKKHKKEHKRNESLVEMHQKKLRKEQRKKAKELAASGAKPERRPFTRDVDLKLNKVDKNQTKQIVDKAKILNTKFSSGHSKYL